MPIKRKFHKLDILIMLLLLILWTVILEGGLNNLEVLQAVVVVTWLTLSLYTGLVTVPSLVKVIADTDLAAWVKNIYFWGILFVLMLVIGGGIDGVVEGRQIDSLVFYGLGALMIYATTKLIYVKFFRARLYDHLHRKKDHDDSEVKE